MRTKLYMNKFGSLFGAAILALASVPVNASLIMYDTYDAWAHAVFLNNLTETSDILTERFEVDVGPSAVKITFVKSQIDSVVANPEKKSLRNEVELGRYLGHVGVTADSETITWIFPDSVFLDPVLGFFAVFGNITNGIPLDVTVKGIGVEDSTFTVGPFDYGDTVGFGVLGEDDSDLFREVVWSSTVNQIFTSDNLAYIGTDSSPVPAPAALWLFGTGLLGLIGFNRRRKAV
jgi:hypothetical protein